MTAAIPRFSHPILVFVIQRCASLPARRRRCMRRCSRRTFAGRRPSANRTKGSLRNIRSRCETFTSRFGGVIPFTWCFEARRVALEQTCLSYGLLAEHVHLCICVCTCASLFFRRFSFFALLPRCLVFKTYSSVVSDIASPSRPPQAPLDNSSITVGVGISIPLALA